MFKSLINKLFSSKPPQSNHGQIRDKAYENINIWLATVNHLSPKEQIDKTKELIACLEEAKPSFDVVEDSTDFHAINQRVMYKKIKGILPAFVASSESLLRLEELSKKAKQELSYLKSL